MSIKRITLTDDNGNTYERWVDTTASNASILGDRLTLADTQTPASAPFRGPTGLAPGRTGRAAGNGIRTGSDVNSFDQYDGYAQELNLVGDDLREARERAAQPGASQPNAAAATRTTAQNKELAYAQELVDEIANDDAFQERLEAHTGAYDDENQSPSATHSAYNTERRYAVGTTESLQKALTGLGITDRDGQLLQIDGRFGPRTKSAVENYKATVAKARAAEEAAAEADRRRQADAKAAALRKALQEQGILDSDGQLLQTDGQIGARTSTADNDPAVMAAKAQAANAAQERGSTSGEDGDTPETAAMKKVILGTAHILLEKKGYSVADDVFAHGLFGRGSPLPQKSVNGLTTCAKEDGEFKKYVEDRVSGKNEVDSFEFRHKDLFYTMQKAKVDCHPLPGKGRRYLVTVTDTYDFDWRKFNGFPTYANNLGYKLQESGKLTPFPITLVLIYNADKKEWEDWQ